MPPSQPYEQFEEEVRERLLCAESLRQVARRRHEVEHAEGFDDLTYDELSLDRQLRLMDEAKRDLQTALDSTLATLEEGQRSIEEEGAAEAAIEIQLRAHPEVRWDRFIEYDGKLRVYGWLPREDGRADFLLLDYNAATGVLTDWITSAHPHPASVVKRLEGEASVECQRVEDHFSVPNAVRLSEERPQPPAPALSDEQREKLKEAADLLQKHAMAGPAWWPVAFLRDQLSSPTEHQAEGQLERYEAALHEIAGRPTVERNPDGIDQAAHSMQLIARTALEGKER